MNTSKNPLESIYFINLPEEFKLSKNLINIDKTIPLPVQKKDKEALDNCNTSELTPEQILAGILTVLAYDKHNKHLDYYRNIIKSVRPEIQKELTQTAVLKAKNEDWEIAEELFITLKALEPENPAISLNYALFLDQRAEAYRKSGLTEDADAYDNDAFLYYRQAMEAEPAIPDAFFNAGFFYSKQHNYREAKNAFETYIALTCDISDEELGESGIYKKERAMEIVNRITNGNMDDAAFQSAYKHISSGEEEKGLEIIKSFITRNPKVWNAWFLLGWGLRRIGRYEDARQAFIQCIDCGGENADTYNELAICLLEKSDIKEAKKTLIKALSLSPENPKIISNLGFVALKEGNKNEAKKYFQIVLEFVPNDSLATEELAKLENL